jgi:beta-glucanase (GH16 family)
MRVRPRRIVYACVAISAVLLASMTPNADAASRHSTPAPCGGEAVQKPDGTPWTCSFDDDFSGHKLDATKFTAWDTATTGFHAGIECLTPANVSQNGKSLVLSATKLRNPAACGSSLTSQYDSGMVGTLYSFVQTYGRFEIRAKLPQGIGMQPAFWMLPQNPQSTGKYEYGEIDVAEAWGVYQNIASPHLHYVSTPGNIMGGVNCAVPDFAKWHTFAVEWTRTQMSFIYDGTTCWTTSWQPLYPYAPAGASSPVPFDQPFFMMVTLAVDGTGANAVSAKTKFPQRMYVDYVRAWK